MRPFLTAMAFVIPLASGSGLPCLGSVFQLDCTDLSFCLERAFLDQEPSPQPGEGHPSGAPAPEASTEPGSLASVFGSEITGDAWIASVAGSLQTAHGGGAGTTSPHRPTVHEIGLGGLQALPLLDARLIFLSGHELHVSYVPIDLNGSDALGSTLISQGQTFPLGAHVTSRLELDMLRLGYRALWVPLSLGSWSIAPEIGVDVNPFHYQLSSPAATGPANRSYVMAFPYIGALIQGPILGSLSGEVELAGSAGINGATYMDADVRLAYPIAAYRSFSASIVLGLKGTWLRRRDYQSPQHNDINVRVGAFADDPWGGLTAGLRISF